MLKLVIWSLKMLSYFYETSSYHENLLMQSNAVILGELSWYSKYGHARSVDMGGLSMPTRCYTSFIISRMCGQKAYGK